MNGKVTCPTCKHRYEIPEEQMGGRQVCPGCQSPFFAAGPIAGARTSLPPPMPPAGFAQTMIGEAVATIKYTCPRCKAPLEAAATEAGTKKNCPHCSQRLQVPPLPGTQPAVPSLNKTMLTPEESVVAARPRQGAPVADGMRGPVPLATGSLRAGPWEKVLHSPKVLAGIIGALLLVLLLVVVLLLRGGKSADTDAQAKAQIEKELEKLKNEIEQKKTEMEERAKAQDSARQQIEETRAKNKAEDDRRREEEQRRLRDIDDEARRAALKKQLQQEQEQRDKERQAREKELQQKLEEAKKSLEDTRRELEKSLQKEKEVAVQAPAAVPVPVPLPGRKVKRPKAVLPDPGTLVDFANNTGATYAFRVTGFSGAGAVWGTDVYTSDSVLAAAAVHAGVLADGQTGVVLVTILPGRPAYAGSVRNGVNSASWPSWGASYRIR